MKDLQRAKHRLLSGGYTCVLCRGEQESCSEKRGVKPLLTWKESGENFEGFSAADKVVGKATAFLYLSLGVVAVYAGVISRSALQVLQRGEIAVEYGTLVENIINRQGDGICPFEFVVLEIEDVDEACAAIYAKLRQMASNG